MKYIFQCGTTDEIYYDSKKQGIAMVGDLGEDFIPLREKLVGVSAAEKQLIVMAAFLYTVQQYTELQMSGSTEESSEPLPQLITEIEFEYDPDSKLVENRSNDEKVVESTGGSIKGNKKDEMN
jgi:3D (Asp-Asp-Asp) domain-containing protein